ncbi:unnamed protein product [Paramecium sonneborni]|uniref:Dynein heavy chain linker domain-containing protein n=1 Tax=Paramecium sonneborni TaxID=65129 RepID=A0A8S1RUR5_9CILI|nr:unnamed protein product [Paramecium sonneborni]
MLKVDQEEIHILKDRDQLEQFIRERREKYQNNLDEITSSINRLKTSYFSAYQVKGANDIVDTHVMKLLEYVAEKKNTQFVKLQDAQKQIVKDVKTKLTQAKKLTQKFRKNVTPQGPMTLIKYLTEKINDFQVLLPLVRVFSNPDMKKRHWEEISQIMGFPVRPDKEQQLSKLIEQYYLEKILNKMQKDWDIVITELKPQKDTAFLYYTQPLFDYLKVQGVWMYLELVFTSSDNLKHTLQWNVLDLRSCCKLDIYYEQSEFKSQSD